MKLIHCLAALLALASCTAGAQGTAASVAPPASATVSAPKPYTGLGAASVPPEVLAKYRPKELDPVLSRSVQAMMDVSAPGAGLLSPDGRRLFFTWRVTGVTQVWRLDGPQRFPVQLTGGEDATRVVAVSKDGRTLVLQRDRKGEENPGLYLQSAEGGPLKEIQHKAKVQTHYQRLSEDGEWLYFSANDQRPDSRALYRYHLKSGQRETVLAEPGLWHVASLKADGHMLLARAMGSAHTEYFEWFNGQLTPLLGQGETEEFDAVYGPKDGELLVLTPKFSNFARLYRYQRPGAAGADGRWDAITPELNADVAGFSFNRAAQRVLYTVNDKGYMRTAGLDLASGKALELPRFTADADHVFAGGSTRSGQYTVFSVETAKAPRTSYVYHWSTGKLTQWVLPSSPEIDTTRFARAALESYPARDGTAIPMFVRRPAKCATQACPVVVHFHGGPEGQSLPGFSTYAQLFVDAGYIYVDPNVRGSEGYGKAWFHADDGPKRLNVISDIEDAALFIRKHWARDGVAPRIGVVGGSYGGYAVLMAMTRFGGAYDAGVSNVGISNLLTFLNNTAPYRRRLRINEYGDPERDRDALIALSPTTYIDRLQAPLLIIQGASDPRVPVGESLQMYEAAQSRGVRSELMIFADEGHGAQRRDNRVATVVHTLRFLDQALK